MQILPTRRPQSNRRGGNNGGFPEPPEGEPTRLLSCSHSTCGAETRIRLPERLPERVVKRVVCDGCRQTFTTAQAAPGATPETPGTPQAPEPLEPAPAEARNGEQASPSPLPPAASTAAAFALGDRAAGGPGRTAEAEGAAEPEPTVTEIRESQAAAPAGRRATLRERASAAVRRAGDRLGELRPATAADGSGGIRDRVRELADGLPRPSLPDTPAIPRRRLWAWVSVPLAIAGVIVALALIQGSSPAPRATADAAQAEAADRGAKLVSDAGYSLALPSGWKRTDPPDGAVFAAEARDGSADATLWIERAPGLTLKEFERRSLDQLDEITENPRVVDRVSAPTIAGSIIELRGESPVADGITAPYRVTLRGAGPFLRHYLATAQQPGADPKIVADIEIMHNSLRPEVKLAGTGGS